MTELFGGMPPRMRETEMYGESEQVNGAVANTLQREVDALQAKLDVAANGLREIMEQNVNLREGGCDPILDFDGLEDGLTSAVVIAGDTLSRIMPPNAAV